MKIEGFDARSYDRIVALLAPGLRSRSPNKERERAQEHGGFLWVVFDQHGVQLALHSHRGVVEQPAGWTGPESLAEFAALHDATVAIAVDAQGFERMLTRWGARTDLQDSFVEQWLIVAENVRELIDERALFFVPQLWPSSWPRPTAPIVETSVALALAPGKAVVVLLYDGPPAAAASSAAQNLDTAMVLVRDEDGGFSRCVGPEVLLRQLRLGRGPIATELQATRRWVEATYAPVHLAIATSTQNMHALLRTPQSSEWLAAVYGKTLHVDGSAPWIVAASAAATAQAALETARGWLGIFGKKREPSKPAENVRPKWTTQLLKTWSGILSRTSESSSTL